MSFYLSVLDLKSCTSLPLTFINKTLQVRYLFFPWQRTPTFGRFYFTSSIEFKNYIPSKFKSCCTLLSMLLRKYAKSHARMKRVRHKAGFPLGKFFVRLFYNSYIISNNGRVLMLRYARFESWIDYSAAS